MALSALLFLPFLSQAQPAGLPANSGTPAATLHVKARAVVVDVSVRDEQGRPVRGLSRKEFSVAEDGQPRRCPTAKLATCNRFG
jgi:hypothetical protein